jgi:hypothetical protein
MTQNKVIWPGNRRHQEETAGEKLRKNDCGKTEKAVERIRDWLEDLQLQYY